MAVPPHAKLVADVVEDLQFMADNRVGATEAAHRAGFPTTDALDRWLRRHGHAQLLNQLTRQDYAALTNTGPTRHLRTVS